MTERYVFGKRILTNIARILLDEGYDAHFVESENGTFEGLMVNSTPTSPKLSELPEILSCDPNNIFFSTAGAFFEGHE
jgi:hypothetical protein